MFSAQSKYPIAIDMSNHDIYAAQFRHSRKGPLVRGLTYRKGSGEITELRDGGNALTSLLKDISKDKNFSGRRVALHLPSHIVSSFPLGIQVEKEESLEEAILRESKAYISFPMEKAVIDYPSLVSLPSDDAAQYKAIIVAAQRDHINQYFHISKRAGLTVEAVDFGVSSLIRLHSHIYNAPCSPVILCHIDNAQSLIAVVTKESILAARYVPWGLRYLMAKIEASLELPNNEDRTKILLKKYGLSYDDDQGCKSEMDQAEGIRTDSMQKTIYQIITPYIEELINEFHKITAYLRSEEKDAVVERIYIYGQGTFINRLDDYIQKRFNIPTTLINPMMELALDDEGILPDISEGAPFGLVLGLAMRKVTWL